MLLRLRRTGPASQSFSRHPFLIVVASLCFLWLGCVILIASTEPDVHYGISFPFGGERIQHLDLSITPHLFLMLVTLLLAMVLFAGLLFLYKNRRRRARFIFFVGEHEEGNNSAPPWYNAVARSIFPNKRNLYLGDALLFDPATGITRQGDETCFLTATNASLEDVVIDKETISPGCSIQIPLKIDTHIPGKDRHIGRVEYWQGEKRFIEPVITEYVVSLRDEDLGVSFLTYVYRHGTLVPVILVKNFTNQQITLDNSIVIAPGFEGEIELPYSVSPVHVKSSQMAVSYQKNGKEHKIRVNLPMPQAYQMLAKGMIHQVHSHLASQQASSDAEFWYHCGVIYEQCGELDDAEEAYRTALELDPYHAQALHSLRHLLKGSGVHGFYTSHIRGDGDDAENLFALFPSALLPRYQPLRVLACDTFAMIFLCIRKDNGKERALKVFNPGSVDQGTFYLKVASWQPLHHPHILTLYTAEFSPVTFLEMEYTPGILYRGHMISSLAEISFPIKTDAAWRICVGILEALLYLHRQGVRHFDLQPRFVLIGAQLIPKISGFVIFAEERRDLVRFFSCPERIDPERYGRPGTKCDVYSAGTILYTMLTGALWECDGSSRLPSAYRASLAPYDLVIMQMLAPQKEKRCSVEEAIALLHQIM